jgi:glycosyltransferase involved in cell wall biosynthesis
MIADSKLKLVVTIGTLDHMGGAERQALYVVEHLSKLRRCTVEVLTFEDGTALRAILDPMGIKVHVRPYYELWPRIRRARALSRLSIQLRRVRPHALLPFGAPSSKVMGLVWKPSGAKFCWWNQQDEGRGLHGTKTERKVLHRMPRINSNSFIGRDFLARTYGLPPHSIKVYNNGTPIPEARLDSNVWRSKRNVEGRPIVTMIGNLTEFKDHLTLIESWPAVLRNFSDSTRPALMLAGFLKDRARVTLLKLRAFELGLSSSDVHFLGPVDDVGGLLRESDLVVHSSLTEGCPNAVCEAMASGLPVIATDIPGCRQALGENQAHWLVAPKDPDALSARILELLSSPVLRQEVGAANRVRIATEFSITSMNEFFQAEIESGLGTSLD